MGGGRKEVLVRISVTICSMGKKKRNYSRFYALCKAKGIDVEQHKDDLVSQFTRGRTTSLREMRDSEYEEMCDRMQGGGRQPEGSDDYVSRRKKMRSAVLKRIQRIGVDTTDFDRVNEFCQNSRIAGKPFGMLTIEELESLIPKLEAIIRKPKPQKAGTVRAVRIFPVYLGGNSNQLPS